MIEYITPSSAKQYVNTEFPQKIIDQFGPKMVGAPSELPSRYSVVSPISNNAGSNNAATMKYLEAIEECLRTDSRKRIPLSTILNQARAVSDTDYLASKLTTLSSNKEHYAHSDLGYLDGLASALSNSYEEKPKYKSTESEGLSDTFQAYQKEPDSLLDAIFTVTRPKFWSWGIKGPLERMSRNLSSLANAIEESGIPLTPK